MALEWTNLSIVLKARLLPITPSTLYSIVKSSWRSGTPNLDNDPTKPKIGFKMSSSKHYNGRYPEETPETRMIPGMT